jgi:hypothetical protein
MNTNPLNSQPLGSNSNPANNIYLSKQSGKNIFNQNQNQQNTQNNQNTQNQPSINLFSTSQSNAPKFPISPMSNGNSVNNQASQLSPSFNQQPASNIGSNYIAHPLSNT